MITKCRWSINRAITMPPNITGRRQVNLRHAVSVTQWIRPARWMRRLADLQKVYPHALQSGCRLGLCSGYTGVSLKVKMSESRHK